MLDKELLKDLGFVLGTGWDHEVWVYDGIYWLHYGNYDRERWLSLDTAKDGITITRKELLSSLIQTIKDEARDSVVTYDFQD